MPDDFALRPRASQLDDLLEPQARDTRSQLGLEETGPNDLARETAAARDEDRAGFDQIAEPLLLDEPPDRHDSRRALVGSLVWKLLEVEAVVDALHMRGCSAVGLA